jgi:hypothetical protein
MTVLGLRTADVSVVGRHSMRVAMDGDGSGSGDMREVEGVLLRQPWMSGLWETACWLFAERWWMQSWKWWSW